MGSAAAFNIEVDVSETEAVNIAAEVAEEFGFDDAGHDGRIAYKFEVPDEMDSGEMSTSNDVLWISYDAGSEYDGASRDETLTVHYSPYYSEGMDTLREKLALLDDIEEFLIERVPEEVVVEYYVSTCTV